MARIVLLVLVIVLIIWKLHRINKKVLCAKAYIFINEINKKSSLTDANYKANLFDFFKHEEARKVFNDMKYSLKADYDNKGEQMIFRAKAWGFADTHTRSMFAKKKKAGKIIEETLLIQNPGIFSGNAVSISKEITAKYWDINALLMHKLDTKICALKLLMEYNKENKNKFAIAVAADIANNFKGKTQYLDKEDLDIISEWNSIIKKKKDKNDE